jgi:hypothetical protein
MIDIVLIIIWVSICFYWAYLHFRFYRVFKNREPAIYKENSGWSPLKYSTGFACFDFALSGGHKSSDHESVVTAGNRLVKAYDAKFKFVGFGLLLSCVWFAVTVFI